MTHSSAAAKTAEFRRATRQVILGPCAALVILTTHARLRMSVRAIDIAWVEAVIRQPERSSPDPNDPALTRAWRRIPERGGRALRVVFRQAGGDIVVVSVVFDRGARRWLP
jgi:hypothetical protein